MLTKIFGDCSQVKVIDFLLAHPWSEFSKTELADGAQITRPTLYKLLDRLLDEHLIVETKKVGNIQLYQTNRKCAVIKHISSLQGLLADMELEKQKKSFNEESITLNDEELDELLGLNDDEKESKSIKKSEDLSRGELVSSDATRGLEIKQVKRAELR
jgi:hypothetical protein